MTPTQPVYLETPDGVKRLLRFTFGARKRIVDRFGMGLVEALNKYDAGALPELLYCLMYDDKGNPPENFEIVDFIESDMLEDSPALMATLMQAATKGRVEKKKLEEIIRQKMYEEMERLIGFTSGLSPISASEEGAPTSGNSPNGNSTHSSTDTQSDEISKTSAQD